MRELSFAVDSVTTEPFAAAPHLLLQLRITAPAGVRVDAILLRAQVQIDAPARSYAATERASLKDLFGEGAVWGRALRPMLWTHAQTTVATFETATNAPLPVPCIFDYNAAATRYFHALESGDVPINLLFSGTVFARDEHGALRATQLPTTAEARYALPLATWQSLRERHAPQSASLVIPRDLFDRLNRFRIDAGAPTIEHALDRLLARTEPG